MSKLSIIKNLLKKSGAFMMSVVLLLSLVTGGFYMVNAATPVYTVEQDAGENGNRHLFTELLTSQHTNLLKGIRPTILVKPKDETKEIKIWTPEKNNGSENYFTNIHGYKTDGSGGINLPHDTFDCLSNERAFTSTAWNDDRFKITLNFQYSKGAKFVYTLSESTIIDKFMLISFWQANQDYAIKEYKLYVADSYDELFKDNSEVAHITAGERDNDKPYLNAGQIVTFTENKPTGKYFGIDVLRETADSNKHEIYLQEVGLYGTVPPPAPVNSDSAYEKIDYGDIGAKEKFDEQLAKTNLLNGVSPKIVDYQHFPEGDKHVWYYPDETLRGNWYDPTAKTPEGVNIVDGTRIKPDDPTRREGDPTSVLTNGKAFIGKKADKITNSEEFYMSQGGHKEGAVFIYELNERSVIDASLMLSNKYTGDKDYTIREYKIYVSDSYEDVLDGSNMIVHHDNTGIYVPGDGMKGVGQHITFLDGQKPIGKFVAVYFIKASGEGSFEEGKTDTCLRLEEIGVYGESFVGEPVNVANNKNVVAYLTDTSGKKELVADNVFTNEMKMALTDGDPDNSVGIDSTGKVLDYIIDLGKEMTVDQFKLTNFGADTAKYAKEFKIFGANNDSAVWNNDAMLAHFNGENTDKTVSFENTKKADTVRFIRFSIVKSVDMIADFEAIGDSAQEEIVKNQLQGINKEKIYLYKHTIETGAFEVIGALDTTSTVLVDNDITTGVTVGDAVKGTETIDYVFELNSFKSISEFKFAAAEGKIPSMVEFYLADTLEDLFHKDMKPVAIYEKPQDAADDVVSVRINSTSGRFVRLSVVDTAEEVNQKMVSTINEIKALGVNVASIVDESGDPTVAKSFTDVETGTRIYILKNTHNDVFTKAKSMELKKVEVSDAEKATLDEGFNVYKNTVYTVEFKDLFGNVLADSDLGGRSVRILMPMTDFKSDMNPLAAIVSGASIKPVESGFNENTLDYTIVPTQQQTYNWSFAALLFSYDTDDVDDDTDEDEDDDDDGSDIDDPDDDMVNVDTGENVFFGVFGLLLVSGTAVLIAYKKKRYHLTQV